MTSNTKVESQETIGDLIYITFGILMLIQIALIIVLAFINIDKNLKFFVIAIYSIITLPVFYLGFFWYFKKTEFRKKDFTAMKDIQLDRFHSIFLYAIPILFSIFIINYVSIYLNIQSIIQPLGILNIFSGYSKSVPGLNFDTVIVFMIILFAQVGYLASIPGSVAKEYKFYKAKEYFEKAKSVKDDSTSNVKKINLFIKGLDFYDEYLRKAFKHKIDKNKIFSKLIADSRFTADEKIEELRKAFQSTDKLFPVKKMSELTNNEKADELLVRISRIDTFKQSFDGVMSAIPIVSIIISLVFGIKI